jgi:pyruvate/2-oxoglutarate dehydrogenase complex dihydrolipoamide acyltransferase (E2) component
MTDMVLPQYGMGMADGTIIVWHKAVGDYVEAGEPICDVEAAKTTVEVGASVSGIVQQILVPAGTNVPVNSVIAVIGDEVAIPLVEAVEPQAAALTLAIDPAPPAAPAPVMAKAIQARTLQSEPKGQIEPRARRAARLRGVDLATINGSGPGGRIIEEDVIRLTQGSQPAITAPVSSILHQLRFRCDAKPVLRLLGELAELRGQPVPAEAVIVKATAIALEQAGTVSFTTAIRRSGGAVIMLENAADRSLLLIASKLGDNDGDSGGAPAFVIEYHDEDWLDEAINIDPGNIASLSVVTDGQEWRICLAVMDQTMTPDQAKRFCKMLRDLLLNPLAILV